MWLCSRLTLGGEAGMLKDSGERREFSSGAVRDMGGEDKGRCDLLPLDALYELYPEDLFFGNMYQWQHTRDIKYLAYAFAYLAKRYSLYNARDITIADYLLEVARHMRRGAEKYGERNWEKGIPVSSYEDSAVRHYLKYLRGDSDEPHLTACGWNVICALATVLRGIDPTIEKGHTET